MLSTIDRETPISIVIDVGSKVISGLRRSFLKVTNCESLSTTIYFGEGIKESWGFKTENFIRVVYVVASNNKPTAHLGLIAYKV